MFQKVYPPCSIADSVQAGIVSGRNGAELAPKALITRAEVAAIWKPRMS
ncbi:S-layer homology domain-containing protein [Paenibacillus sp. MZ04-78.2]